MKTTKLPIFSTSVEAIVVILENYKSLLRVGLPSILLSFLLIPIGYSVFGDDNSTTVLESTGEIANVQTEFFLKIAYFGSAGFLGVILWILLVRAIVGCHQVFLKALL